MNFPPSIPENATIRDCLERWVAMFGPVEVAGTEGAHLLAVSRAALSATPPPRDDSLLILGEILPHFVQLLINRDGNIERFRKEITAARMLLSSGAEGAAT